MKIFNSLNKDIAWHPAIAVCLIMFILATSTNSEASEREPVAKVIAARGMTQAKDDKGDIRNLSTKTPIYKHDLITTGKNGRIQIMFTDNTIISLGRNAEMQISEYLLNHDKTGELTTKVSEGVFRVMGGLITKNSPDRFKTQTPSGNIGIRGSMYLSDVNEEETTVVFEGGKGITYGNKTGKVDISEPDNGTTVRGDNSKIPEPRKYSHNELKSMRKNMAMRPSDGPADRNKTPSSFRVPASFSLKRGAKAPIPGKTGTDEKETGKEQTEQGKTEQEKKKEIEELTKQVMENPAEADKILKNAVEAKGLKVDQALEAVLKGMKNPTKDDFDKLKNQALDMGITLEGAKELINTLKKSGEICK